MPLEVSRLSNNIKFVILKIVVVFVNLLSFNVNNKHSDSNDLAVFKTLLCSLQFCIGFVFNNS